MQPTCPPTEQTFSPPSSPPACRLTGEAVACLLLQLRDNPRAERGGVPAVVLHRALRRAADDQRWLGRRADDLG